MTCSKFYSCNSFLIRAVLLKFLSADNRHVNPAPLTRPTSHERENGYDHSGFQTFSTSGYAGLSRMSHDTRPRTHDPMHGLSPILLHWLCLRLLSYFWGTRRAGQVRRGTSQTATQFCTGCLDGGTFGGTWFGTPAHSSPLGPTQNICKH